MAGGQLTEVFSLRDVVEIKYQIARKGERNVILQIMVKSKQFYLHYGQLSYLVCNILVR